MLIMQTAPPKKSTILHEEQIAILLGRRPGLNVRALYLSWVEQGFEIPEELKPVKLPEGTPVSETRQSKRSVTGPGRELTKLLAWVAKIKPDRVKCSCKNLASEMDKDGVTKCLARRDGYYLPKLLANKTDIAKQLQSEGGLLSIAGTVAAFVPDAVALSWIKLKFNSACESARKSQGEL